MRALANNRCSHPHIRDLALRIIGHATTPGEQITRLRSWLRSRIRFVPDPDVTELLHDPVLLAQWIERDGSTGVDCDDVATLGAALGKAIGIPARFVVVGFYFPDAPYGHIWTELFDGERWRELDTTRQAQGVEDSRVSRRAVVDVATGNRGDGTMAGMVTTRRVGSFPARQNGLGWAQAVPVVISTITTLQSLAQGGKEPGRIEANKQAETLAMSGGPGAQSALEFLRCRSGKFGLCTIEGYPEQIGGWATQTAKDDAYARYNNVVRSMGYAPGSGGSSTGGGTTTVRTPIGGGTVNNSTLILGGLAAFLLLKRR